MSKQFVRFVHHVKRDPFHPISMYSYRGADTACNLRVQYFHVFSTCGVHSLALCPGNDIFKEELPSGSRLAPGYVENLTPVTPFHDEKEWEIKSLRAQASTPPVIHSLVHHCEIF